MRKYLLLCLVALLGIIILYVFEKYRTGYSRLYKYFENLHDVALVEMGNSYYKRNSLDSAMILYSIVCSKYNSGLPDEMKRLYAHSFNRCGSIYLRYNNYTKGLRMFLNSLDICEETDDQEYTSKIYNNIANVYYLFKDYETSSKFCEKAYELGVKNHDKEMQNIALKNQIGLDCFLGDYEKVQEHLKLFNRLQTNDIYTFHYYQCISNGAINLKQQKFSEALVDFHTSSFYADSCATPKRMKYASLSNLSKTFLYMQRSDSAIYYLKKAEEIASSNDQYLNLLVECYDDFAEIYKNTNNASLYLEYKKRFLNVADSILNMQKFSRIKDMQFFHEMDKVEKRVYYLNEMQSLKDEQIKFQQFVLMTVACAFVIILLLSVILSIQNKKLKKANNELFNRNIEMLKFDDEEKKKRWQACNENEGEEDSPEIIQKVKYQGSVISDEEKRQLQEAIQNVMDNTLEYCSVDFNLDKMASLVNSRTKYVSQVINECYGKNFNIFINEYRIKEACRKLIDVDNYGSYTIAHIAESVGFKSNANFNVTFKKMTGITPSMYQSIAKKRKNQPEA